MMTIRSTLAVVCLLCPLSAEAQVLRLAVQQATVTSTSIDLGLPTTTHHTTMSPERLATLGGLADATATTIGLYLHAATGEGNPMLAQMSPMHVGVSLVAQLAIQKGVTALLRKRSPRLADAIAANMGARQVGLATNWVELIMGDFTNMPLGGNEDVRRAFERAGNPR